MAEKKDSNGVITPAGSSSRPIQGNEEPSHNGVYNLREEIFEVLPQRGIHPGIARISQAQSVERKLDLICEELDRVQGEIEGLLHRIFFPPRSNKPIMREEELYSSEEEEEQQQPRGKAGA